MSGYFFRELDEPLNIEAFCNYTGMGLDSALDLSFPGGLDLKAQLERYRPQLVVGEGEHIFAISPAPEVIEALRARAES